MTEPKVPSTPYYIAPNGIGFSDRGLATKKGELVKVLFLCHEKGHAIGGGEGMWVKITKVQGGVLTGLLVNAPILPNIGADLGDVVHFPRSAVRVNGGRA